MSGTKRGPLRGVRVLDFSIALTGPYAAALMADQGAEVVKVERPGIGDLGRWIGVSVNGMSALYFTCNRGKRSIALDLQQPEGVEVALQLAAQSDVITVSCTGSHGHIWPTAMTSWLTTTLLSYPKGAPPADFELTPPPSGFSCVLGAYSDH